ncbi:phosphatidate cytidylyltransferase [Undibacterium fentianense]|uniref:Phosphatidate cytidylyltransferase n=1 Tax=Undibacterium fentianense TaxID=2828728 RepID=A0A941IC55_9BURK|nr:CDP-archaeol synthase [Undibacterium fentianense]MBR7798498.1 CDP-archaeol synthase [Undibacterium fentianense]
MLKTRIITALVLLIILVPILFSGSSLAFTTAAAIFLGAAMWESQRLFNKPGAIIISLVWSLAFAYLTLQTTNFSLQTLFTVCVLFWVFGLIPSLRFGLPSIDSFASGLISGIYAVAIFGCFVAMSFLFGKSAQLLLSVLAIVWVADIGAYFVGKAIGKRKLAPSISPGKSWEGAIGGACLVLGFATLCVFLPMLSNTFPAKLYSHQGAVVTVLIMLLIATASVIGDLFESLLKRRIGMKDSSHLLPGHGGVLDRIDALIPVLPLAAMFVAIWGLS